MPFNPIFLLSALIGLILFYVSNKVFKVTNKTITKAWLIILSGILALISLVIPLAYLSDIVGANPQYAQFRAYPYTEMMVILSAPLVGIVNGRLTSKKPNRLYTCLCLMATLVYISLPFLKPIIRPLQHNLNNQWKDAVAIQTTASTCGPSSLATILKYYGKEDTEANIAAHAYTSASGSENWYLARYAKSQGFSYQFLQEPELAKVPTPAIIGVRLGNAGHFIVLLAHKNGQFEVADPLSGKEILSLAQFNHKYHYTGFVLYIAQ